MEISGGQGEVESGVRECKNNETVMYVGLLGMTQLMRKIPIALT